MVKWTLIYSAILPLIEEKNAVCRRAPASPGLSNIWEGWTKSQTHTHTTTKTLNLNSNSNLWSHRGHEVNMIENMTVSNIIRKCCSALNEEIPVAIFIFVWSRKGTNYCNTLHSGNIRFKELLKIFSFLISISIYPFTTHSVQIYIIHKTIISF